MGLGDCVFCGKQFAICAKACYENIEAFLGQRNEVRYVLMNKRGGLLLTDIKIDIFLMTFQG